MVTFRHTEYQASLGLIQDVWGHNMMKNTVCEQSPIERRNQTKIQRCLSTFQLLIIVSISNFMSENTMTNMKNRMEEANIIIGGDGIVYLANYR